MATRKTLVVVLPGIGGSVLADDRGDVVWNAGFGSIWSLLRSPGRLSVAEAPRLRPVGLISSRQLVPGWTVVHGYQDLVRRLRGLPGAVIAPGRTDDPVPDANVVLFPYDFRIGIADAAHRLDGQIRDRLRYLGAGAGAGRRVVLVAHSLGGLVAAYWLGVLGGAALCRGVITLGTPYGGAPKALQIMANGVLGGRLKNSVEVLRGWPALAELLPRYPAVWHEAGQRGVYPHDLPIEAVRGPAARAYALHEQIDAGLRGAALPPIDARRGWSHPTLRSGRWDGTTLRVGRDAPTWLDVSGWDTDLGDGTVPAFSAVPVEGDRQSPGAGRVRERHAPLGSAAFVAELVEDYERYADLDRGPIRDAGTTGAISLDLDAEYPAGAPIMVRAGIIGADASPVVVDVVVREPGGVWPKQQIRLEPNGDGWLGGELRGLPPGLYDVQVDAPSVPGVGDLRVVDSVAVLEL